MAPPVRPPAQDRYAEDSRRDYDHRDPPPFFPPRPVRSETTFAPEARRDDYPAMSPQAPEADPGYGRGDYYADPAARYDPADAHESQALDQSLGQHPVQPSDEYAPEDVETGAYEHDEDYEYEAAPAEADHDDGRSPIKRRNTAKIAVAVLGLAVFGSAAALGYRAIFKGGIAGPAPIIRADNSPTKVIPTADGSSKSINERLGNGSERLVRRDEDPVELRDPSRASTGAVMPGSGGSFPGMGAFQSSPAASPPGSPPSLTEPRRVHTVTIRADQGAAAPPPDRIGAPPPARTTAAPTQRTVAVVPAAPPPQAAPGSNSGPLSIAPPGMVGADPAPPVARVASAAPVAPSRASDGGGYVVQLSAQKSEADAQSSYRAMQAKFAVLNGHQPLIRRKDQGDRGVFYAAQVGPFGSKDEASQLCDSLKSAGGSCFVQRN